MDYKTLKRLLSFCKQYRKYLFGLVLISMISVGLTLITPVLFGKSIDLLIGKGQVDFESLLVLLGYIVVIILLGSLSQWILARITNKVTYNITSDLRNQAFDKLQKLPLKYIDSHLHGDMISRIINDVDLIGIGLLQSFTSLFTGIMTIVGTLVIMCIINFPIASIVIILTPVSLLVASIIAKKTYRYFQEQLAFRGELGGYVEELIGSQKIVQAFNYQEENEKAFDIINQKMHVSGVKSQFLGALINPTTRVVNSFVYGAVAIFGAISVIQGHFSVGMLSSFLTYANQYTKPFNEISSVMTEMQTALAACTRVFDLLDQQIEVASTTNPKTIPTILGKINIDHLCFRYDLTVPLLEDVSLVSAPGQTIAIVGKTGCGKTTLINLLMRFYDQQKGTIAIDDVDTLDMKRGYLRSLYGMVLQDSWIFQGTVKENIAYGKSDATDEQITTAASLARAHKFIMQLPQGYHTLLEENGGNLSQGQKQLLCIARIMLTNPPMLILDEATSSIDTRTELQIQEAFNALMQGKTTFIVAHRLSTIKNADIILVMEHGQIIEQGTHAQLLKQKGYYHTLYYSQFEV